MGVVALGQHPSVADVAGAVLVIGGVVIQEREELPVTAREEPPG
jgi:drug/metabolite transporter (DMT)-like permease